MAWLAAITDRTKIVWICNPNNPTGTMNTDAEIKAFLAKVPAHVIVVLMKLIASTIRRVSSQIALNLLVNTSNVISLRTFSKIYGLASLRIGYGIGHPDVIRSINQVREPFNTTRFAQAAALAAIKDQDFIQSCREANTAGLTLLKRTI